MSLTPPQWGPPAEANYQSTAVPSHEFPGQPAEAVAPVSRSRRKLWIGLGASALVIAAAVLVLAFTVFGSSDQGVTIKFGLLDSSSSCSGGDGGYSDIGPGMPLTVRNEDNKIIASTTLPETGQDGFGCIWTMHVLVPDDAEQYSVEGGSRGAVTYSREQLEKDDWVVELEIGD
jgi:hypothetical protein